jgi:hypothetical protein
MNTPPRDPEHRHAIQRRDLEVVIRRAVELSAASSDPEERIGEDEILRIGAELGLSPEHVLQAVHEAPAQAEPTLAARVFGPAHVVATRIVPVGEPEALRLLEEYLTVRELLQLRRRVGSTLRLVPAEDTFSSILRVFRRPSGRFHLAHAQQLDVRVRSIEERRTIVALDADLSHRRTAAARQGAVLGGAFGVLAGSATFMGVGALVAGVAGTVEAVLAGGAAGALAFGTALGGSVTAFAGRFRRRLADARTEMDALLDRLERGERLDPPTPPWARRFLGGGERRVLRP